VQLPSVLTLKSYKELSTRIFEWFLNNSKCAKKIVPSVCTDFAVWQSLQKWGCCVWLLIFWINHFAQFLAYATPQKLPVSVLQPVSYLSKIKLYWPLGIGFNFVAFSWSKRSGLAWTVRIHNCLYHFMLYNWWKWHWSVPKIVQSNS